MRETICSCLTRGEQGKVILPISKTDVASSLYCIVRYNGCVCKHILCVCTTRICVMYVAWSECRLSYGILRQKRTDTPEKGARPLSYSFRSGAPRSPSNLKVKCLLANAPLPSARLKHERLAWGLLKANLEVGGGQRASFFHSFLQQVQLEAKIPRLMSFSSLPPQSPECPRAEKRRKGRRGGRRRNFPRLPLPPLSSPPK